MKPHKQLIALTAGLLVASLSVAEPIIVEIDGGEGMNPLGGYAMTPFGMPDSGGGCATSTTSADGLTIDFTTRNGADGTGGSPACMNVESPDWWEWDHGNVFTTDVRELNWVELILPADTRALWVYVGASFRNGSGWIEAFDQNNASSGRTHFGRNSDIAFGPNNTPGFGIYSPDACGSVSRVIIEPSDWGFGFLATNNDPCVSVPEPAPLGLLGLGLLGIALVRRLRSGPGQIDA